MISRSVAIAFWCIATMALLSYACVLAGQYARLFP
jgi:hypothetical protein